jgi:CheR methyltransferase, SAM binding domain
LLEKGGGLGPLPFNVEMPAISRRVAFAGLVLAGCVCAPVSAQEAKTPRTPFITFEEARPVVENLRQRLPDDLKSLDLESIRSAWPAWTQKHDLDTRARLARGDEDSLVNLLLFGTSFTRQPRLTAHQIELISSAADPAAAGLTLDAITLGRLDDLLDAVARPGSNERLSYAKKTFEAMGQHLETAEGRLQARVRTLAALARVLREFGSYAQTIEQARTLGGAGAEFAERSTLFHARGLSSDTSLLPNFAIEEALKAMRASGVLTTGVRRVAVIGPGLDFADKQEGFDFYPEQTVQPFAVLDSLMRLGLADPNDVTLATLDLSPKVNGHLAALHASSFAGRPYVLQLPLDASETWTPDFLRYWASFGDRIGSPATPAAVPSNAGAPRLRAVRVRPGVGSKMTAIDLNIVLQRVELPAEEKFDLIVGTNVFVYYDEFQQALALLNIAGMLRPGGILLSNNALTELPSSRVHRVGNTTVTYSGRSGDGDTIVWYGY